MEDVLLRRDDEVRRVLVVMERAEANQIGAPPREPDPASLRQALERNLPL